MLGPATVALAIPLAGEFHELRRRALPVALALLAGSLTAIISAVGIAWALGASKTIQASLAPKSVTTPIAMGISKVVGGIPALTAALVIFTGILVAIIAQPWFNALRIRDDAAVALPVAWPVTASAPHAHFRRDVGLAPTQALALPSMVCLPPCSYPI